MLDNVLTAKLKCVHSLSDARLVGGCGAVKMGSTRSMSRWDTTHPTFQELVTFLRSAEGKSRKLAEAEAIAIDVSKFLAFCNQKNLRWDYLWNIRKVRQFLAELEEMGIGVDGQLTKIDRLCTALKFYRLEIIDEDDADLDNRVARAVLRLDSMKSGMRPLKVTKRASQLEMLSAQELSLDQVTAVVDNEEMWADFDDTVQALRMKRDVDEKDLLLATSALMALLLFKNWQRPGAAANLTVQEYNEATEIQVGEKVLTVLRVKAHKTGVKGSAKLSLEREDARRMTKYYRWIRPQLDPTGTNPTFLPLPGGRPITSGNKLLRKLEAEYNIEIPTATMVRKMGATISAQRITSASDIALIGTQMSHTPDTRERYYAATKGAQHAAKGFVLMEELRKGKEHKGKIKAKTPRKKAFTDDETEAIERHFSEYISERRTPKLQECRAYLEHPRCPSRGREAKSIQDKVRWLSDY